MHNILFHMFCQIPNKMYDPEFRLQVICYLSFMQ